MSDIFNIKPGTFNPGLVNPETRTVYENSQKFSNVGKLLNDKIKPNIFDDVRVFRAVVLESFMMDLTTASAYNFELDEESPAQTNRVLACRARIPELHPHLLDPFLEENMINGVPNRELIVMHDLFIDASGKYGSESPSDNTALFPGTIIEVEFLDCKTYKQGVIVKILDPAIDAAMAMARLQLQLGAFASFTGSGLSAGFPFVGPIQTPEEIEECAKNYDNPPNGENLNKDKNRHKYIELLHPEFLPYVKCLFWRCYSELGGVECYVNSTLRTYAEQEVLYNKYQACLAAGGETGVDCIPAGRPQGPTATGHGAGMALDVNPFLRNGKLFPHGKDRVGGLEPFDVWEASGVPALVRSVGMGYGGDWKTSYDPVHWHAGNLVRHTTAEIRQREKDEGIPAHRLPNVMKTTAPEPD
jgi:hypothetical protein